MLRKLINDEPNAALLGEYLDNNETWLDLHFKDREG